MGVFLEGYLTATLCSSLRCPPPVPAQVYPIGIPVLYAYILWRNRESLNPRVRADCADGGEQEQQEGAASSGAAFSFLKAKNEYLTKESAEELQERLEKRKQNPDLVPSMFLWKDFSEKNELRIHAERILISCFRMRTGWVSSRMCFFVAANGINGEGTRNAPRLWRNCDTFHGRPTAGFPGKG